MYIIKNALRHIGRAKGRSILIGIIALVISVSACIGLSIRQASDSAREDTLAGMSVTATISFDRSSMMGNMGRPAEGGFDREQFAELMGETSSLTLTEYLVYAEASTVQDFYYTQTAYWNGTDELEPVTTETDSETQSGFGGMGGKGGFGGMGGGMSMASGDFTVIGYSSDSAMTDFAQGTASITSGSVFEEGTDAYECIISEELAVYNSLSVGSVITLANPSAEEETYSLTVVGIYTDSANNDFAMSMFGGGNDPANRIYMSASALQSILDASETVSETVTDEDTGRTYETAVTGTLSATYVFADAEGYSTFEEEVRTLGLADGYTVSSADLTAFENSLTPLETLGTMAGWFLLVILAIGAVVLVVLNVFNVRERKYEIGVLTAMGMKKSKVALQFLCETLTVTMTAIVLGACIGAVCSVPVTNVLLENQIESGNDRQSQLEQNFGRPGSMGGMEMPDELPDMQSGNPFGNIIGNASQYITEIDSAMNLTVVLQMLLLGLLLTLVASAVSVLFVMRYDPQKILANRD